MADMSRTKTPMVEQNPKLRLRNFSEVALGYNEDQALQEAERCLHCSARPCIAACPLNINIPKFLMHISRLEWEEAYHVISQNNAFPSICARVCTKERYCEAACLRAKTGGDPVAISRLERYVGDWAHQHQIIPQGPKKRLGIPVAVAGSGPSALACAEELLQYGYDVTIYEAFHVVGGLLMYGIPEFFLPKALVQNEIERLKQRGVRILTSNLAGRQIDISQLFKMGYRAVYLGASINRSCRLGIPGSNAKSVYTAVEYMLSINLMNWDSRLRNRARSLKGKRVIVIGAGNAAIDCARSALRMGAQSVQVIYRRTEQEVPAVKKAVDYAKQEGVQFKFLRIVKEILMDEQSEPTGVLCMDTQLGQVDQTGRPKPVCLEGTEHEIACDAVISAIGQLPQSVIYPGNSYFETNDQGLIRVNKHHMTSQPGVFAGGYVTRNTNVISTIVDGKRAAACMHQYLLANGQSMG